LIILDGLGSVRKKRTLATNFNCHPKKKKKTFPILSSNQKEKAMKIIISQEKSQYDQKGLEIIKICTTCTMKDILSFFFLVHMQH
jgi:hypothetical protein